ncbi:MAG TPA: hypothetical protein VNI34_08365 [Candidatus Nitrosotalea sp.]|nr:hypothetical protein [Candidatus Nitrosotalea sp.]
MEHSRVARQIDVPADGDHVCDPQLPADLEEFFRLLGAAVEPVVLPDQDRIDGPGSDVLQELAVLRTNLPAVSADVVVHVGGDDGPALGGGEALTVLNLAVHPQHVAAAVFGDPSVDCGCFWHM